MKWYREPERQIDETICGSTRCTKTSKSLNIRRPQVFHAPRRCISAWCSNRLPIRRFEHQAPAGEGVGVLTQEPYDRIGQQPGAPKVLQNVTGLPYSSPFTTRPPRHSKWYTYTFW